jgi:hypothetical protein
MSDDDKSSPEKLRLSDKAIVDAIALLSESVISLTRAVIALHRDEPSEVNEGINTTLARMERLIGLFEDDSARKGK